MILDTDVAALYGVEVKKLSQAVKRNLARFPDDFMFQLTEREFGHLRSHSVTSSAENRSWGGRRYSPRAFTEHGVAMLSSVLRSERAIQVNIEIVRAFVRLRRSMQTNRKLARRIRRLEKRSDTKFRAVFEAIRTLMEPPEPPPTKRIGFHGRTAGPTLLPPHRSDR